MDRLELDGRRHPLERLERPVNVLVEVRQTSVIWASQDSDVVEQRRGPLELIDRRVEGTLVLTVRLHSQNPSVALQPQPARCGQLGIDRE